MMEAIYDQHKHAFLIKDGDEELADVPFLFSDKDHQGNDLQMAESANYNFSLYYKKDVRELEYSIVSVDMGAGAEAQRVGWMIPLSVLTTEDPAILGEQHMNQYAFFAYCYLLGIDEVINRVVDEDELGDVLDEKYPDGCLLITNTTLMPANTTLKHLELSLARNGFFAAPSGYFNPLIIYNRHLKLIPASEALNDDGSYTNAYIEEFLRHHVYDSNSFIRFLYLYQIVEVLLDAEMIELLRDYANKIERNQTTYRTADKALQKNTESERFARVVEHSGLTKTNYVAMDAACNTFLGMNNLENPESIYQVRNHIVHRFRKAVEDEVSVKEICDHLELYLYDLLIKYKKPDANSV